MPQIPSTIGRLAPQPTASVPRYDATVGARGYSDTASTYERMGDRLANDLGRAGQNLKAIGDQQDEAAYQSAKSAFLTQKIAADTQFEQDPDYATAPTRYRETIGKLAGETAQGISNPVMKRRFIEETGYYAGLGQASLEKAGHAKSVTARVDWLNENLKTNMEGALSAKDEATRAGLQQSTVAMIDAEVKQGIVTPGDAARLKREWATNYAKGSIALLPPAEQLAALLPKGAPGAAVPAGPAGPAAITKAPLLPPEVDRAIDRGAANPTDAAILKQFAAVESNGNPGAVNPKSGAAGLLQLMPATAAQYEVKDPLDPEQNVRGAQALLADNRKVLRGALGREPTTAELYLAHQQGATGAAALLANPDQPAVSVLTAVYGDAGKAQAAIAQNGGSADMTAGQFAALWSARFGGRTGATVADAMSGTPPGGWDFSQKTGTAVDFIPPDVRAKMIEDAQTGIKQEQTEARIKIQTGVEVAYADQKQSAFLTGEVDPAFRAQVMAAYPDDRGAAKLHELDRMAEMGQVNKTVKVNGAEDDKAMLADLATQAAEPGPGSADAAQRLADAQKLIDAKQAALGKDPGLWVQQNSPVVADALDQWTSAEDPKEQAVAFNIFAATTLAEQKRQGVVEPKILPADAAAKIGESLNPKPGQSSEEAVANIRQMEQQFGGYVPQVFDQVAGKMSDAALTVAIMSPSQDLAAARLIEANQNKDKLEKATDGTVGSAIKGAVADEFSSFLGTFSHDGAGYAEGLKYQAQAELLTRLYVTQGATPEAAAERVRKEIIDPIYDTSTGVRVPVKYESDVVERGAGAVARDLKTAGLDPVMDDQGAGAEPPRADPFDLYKRNKAYLKPDVAAAAKSPNFYQTKLPPDAEAAFRAWVKDYRSPTDPNYRIPFNPDQKGPQDYDMRGYWAALQAKDPMATSAIDPNDGMIHYPDYWKTPYHETFSAESQWAAPNAPKWNEKDQLVATDGSIVFDDRNRPMAPAYEQYLRSIEANHTWVNSPDGQGLIMLDQLNRPVLKGGKPFQVNFDELQQIGKEQPVDPAQVKPVDGSYLGGTPRNPQEVPADGQKKSDVAHAEGDVFGDTISEDDVALALKSGIFHGANITAEEANLAPKELAKVQIMANRSAVIGLGVNLAKMRTQTNYMADSQAEGMSLAGEYDPQSDRITVDGSGLEDGVNPVTAEKDSGYFNPAVVAHEFAHRGLQMLADHYASIDPSTLSDREREAVSDLKDIASNPRRNEAYVREIQHRASGSGWTDWENEKFGGELDGKYTKDYVASLEMLAARYNKERKPGGPR